MNALTFSSAGWRFIGWLGVASLCALSLLPPSTLMLNGPEHSDKLYHLAAYASLAWWFALGYARSHWRAIALGLALLGVTLEVLQGLTPERMASSGDEITNVLGVLLGLWLASRAPAGFPAFRHAE
jgi:VanZ family protein